MRKVLWVKFGWSDHYRGEQVTGDHIWRNKGREHEAYNFLPDAEGIYHCYVPPQGGGHAPRHYDNTGWTVICLSKHPRQTGIHIVGWYEDATLLGRFERMTARDLGRDIPPQPIPYDWSYCITSRCAFLIPPEFRNQPFSDPSVRQGKHSLLSGPNVKPSPNKERMLTLLEKKLTVLRPVAIHNPYAAQSFMEQNDTVDPLRGFGTPEHRKNVEMAAEREVVAHYARLGFTARRVADLNHGYDYEFTMGATTIHAEIKGTSSASPRFYLTRNENSYRTDPRWRLAIVTEALSDHPTVHIHDHESFEQTFDLDPYVFIGAPRRPPENA